MTDDGLHEACGGNLIPLERPMSLKEELTSADNASIFKKYVSNIINHDNVSEFMELSYIAAHTFTMPRQEADLYWIHPEEYQQDLVTAEGESTVTLSQMMEFGDVVGKLHMTPSYNIILNLVFKDRASRPDWIFGRMPTCASPTHY